MAALQKLFSLVIALSATVIVAMAQEATTTWPYMYPDFLPGRIVMDKGQVVEQRVNVHLAHSKLHYIDNEIIKETMMGHIVALYIGDDTYVPYEGGLLKVEARRENGFVASQTLGNFAALAETGGAYGTSSTTSATMKLSSVDTDSSLGRNHMIILQNKDKGQYLPLMKKYYIVTKDFTSIADRKSVSRRFTDRQDEWKVFLKTSKIKWNDPESLAKILDFIR